MINSTIFLSVVLPVLTLLIVLIISSKIVMEDYKTKKIKNSYIISLLKIFIIILFLNITISFLGHFNKLSYYLTFKFYKLLLFHILITIAISLFFWEMKVWPAGDSKFFITLSIISPFINYNMRGYPYLLSISFLINTFILSALFTIFSFIFQILYFYLTSNHEKMNQIKTTAYKILSSAKSFNIKSLLILVLTFYVYQILFTNLNKLIQIYINQNFIYFFYLFLFIYWEKINNEESNKFMKVIIFLTSLSILYNILFSPLTFLYSIKHSLINTVKFSIIIYIFKYFIPLFIENSSKKKISVNELHEGLILSNDYIKIISSQPYFKNSLTENELKEPLTSETVHKIKTWYTNYPSSTNAYLEIVEAQFFSIWILLGILWQIIFNYNIITTLKINFHYIYTFIKDVIILIQTILLALL